MCSSFASYSFWICLMISWESLRISNLVAANVMAKSSPARTTSYSASLLEVKKLRRIACSTNSPVGDYRIKPTLDLDALDVLSTWNIYYCSLGNSTECVIFLESLTIKSTLTCPFSANLDWYLILYSLNSMAHFNIRSNRSSLYRVLRSGWFVSTITWWAKKYGWSFWAVLFKARVICSIMEY